VGFGRQISETVAFLLEICHPTRDIDAWIEFSSKFLVLLVRCIAFLPYGIPLVPDPNNRTGNRAGIINLLRISIATKCVYAYIATEFDMNYHFK
jgi:hypothetical protein